LRIALAMGPSVTVLKSIAHPVSPIGPGVGGVRYPLRTLP